MGKTRHAMKNCILYIKLQTLLDVCSCKSYMSVQHNVQKNFHVTTVGHGFAFTPIELIQRLQLDTFFGEIQHTFYELSNPIKSLSMIDYRRIMAEILPIGVKLHPINQSIND